MKANYGFHSVLIASIKLYKQTFDYKAYYFWDASKSESQNNTIRVPDLPIM